MMRWRWTAPLLGAVLLIASAQADGTRELFNGKDLTGWVVEGIKEYKDPEGQVKPVWSVQEGLLVCNGRGFGFLRYAPQEFSDFAFHVEYRMARKCNSGIGIRTRAFDPKQSQATRPSYYSYEIQLLDDAGQPPTKHSSGSLYRYVAPKANPVKPVPEWNTIDIECVGPQIRVTLNGQQVVDVDQRTLEEIKNKPLKGFVCLQNHGGKIEFRHIRLQEIQAAGK